MNNINIKQFMLAGNATFTVVNTETNNRFTFKVRKGDDRKPHFVSVLTGSDNENDFTFLGSIFPNRQYRHGQRSTIPITAQSAKVFEWLFRKIYFDSLPTCIKIHHEGRCGRCGRKLTVPESIESGFGPECISLIGN